MMTVGVAIITWKDVKRLPKVLGPVLNSTINGVKPRVLVFNSSGGDGTAELAKEMGAEVLIVPRTEMNHGWMREKSRRLLNTDIFVAITGDCILKDEKVLEKLVKPIMDGKASVAYARQLPNDQANSISRFGKIFSYPAESNIRGIEDVEKYGVYTAFCSDACCAWEKKALDEVGGFRWLMAGEDAVAASMMVKKGYKVAYVAEAEVIHSHNYTLKVEFVRHFHTGLYRKQWEPVLKLGGGGDEKRGAGYAKQLLVHIWKTDRKLIGLAFMSLVFGFVGYKFGRLAYKRLPISWYQFFSPPWGPADFFWPSVGYKAGLWFEPIDSEKLIFKE